LEDGTQLISSRSDEREVLEALEEINYQSLYTKDLYKLRTELEQKYILKNISSILYALAVDISCLDANPPNPNNKLVYCLLANRNKVLGEF
jgi:uncharacterized membrane protein YheB (UPF0754 family)